MNIRPTFLETSFSFPGLVPDHVEAQPFVPNYPGLFVVYALARANKPMTLAVDVPTLRLAKLLAEARGIKQEEDIDVFGYSDDVYILSPRQAGVRVYSGRTL